jgi:protein-tyrosine phosphatase
MSRVQAPSPTPNSSEDLRDASFLVASTDLPFEFPFNELRRHTWMSLYWINLDDVRLGIMPRPRGNDWLPDDLRTLRKEGVDVIASALTAPEAEELGLSAEAQACTQSGLIFVSFPIEDRSLPTDQTKFDSLVDQLLQYSKNGRSIAVHCRAGIGRSSLIAACVLVKMGFSAEAAFHAIELSRGCPIPDTPEQRQWVERYSDSLKPRMK